MLNDKSLEENVVISQKKINGFKKPSFLKKQGKSWKDLNRFKFSRQNSKFHFKYTSTHSGAIRSISKVKKKFFDKNIQQCVLTYNLFREIATFISRLLSFNKLFSSTINFLFSFFSSPLKCVLWCQSALK